MKMFIPLFAFVAVLALAKPGFSEHRVALLIDNSQHENPELAVSKPDLEKLTKGLKKYGFRCLVETGLTEDQLKAKIDSFARSTPTRSTALVYFCGSVLPGSYRGTEGLCLVGTNSKAGRGFGIDAAFEMLHTLGGSDRNFIVCDSPTAFQQVAELPAECLLAGKLGRWTEKIASSRDLATCLKSESEVFHSTIRDAVEGTGSVAISPPEKFVSGNQAGDEWVDSRGMVFCWCPAGSFMMGSPADEKHRYEDEAQQIVEIHEGFWISKYEVTFGLWTGSGIHRASLGGEKNHPVNMVNQSKDIRARAIGALNKSAVAKNQLPTDWEYALPTEEQWEYAARAGMKTQFSFGNDETLLPRYANFADKSFYETKDIYSNYAHRTLDDRSAFLAKVGSYQPNAWGLHDVHGNVAEWCENNSTRGGSWASRIENCRSAYRDVLGDRDARNYLGARYVIRRKPK